MIVSQWPSELQTRTADEWRQMGSEEGWNHVPNRGIFLQTLMGLKVSTQQYAQLLSPGRAELIIQIQESLKPGSTASKKAATPAPAPAPAAEAVSEEPTNLRPPGIKKAAPKAANPGMPTPVTAAPVASAVVDFGPVLARFSALETQVAGLTKVTSSVETLLKLLLLNPASADSLMLAGEPAVLAEIAGKTVGQLAGNE